jgi:hypothetical protein
MEGNIKVMEIGVNITYLGLVAARIGHASGRPQQMPHRRPQSEILHNFICGQPFRLTLLP